MYNIGRNVRSVIFVETAKNSNVRIRSKRHTATTVSFVLLSPNNKTNMN